MKIKNIFSLLICFSFSISCFAQTAQTVTRSVEKKVGQVSSADKKTYKFTKKEKEAGKKVEAEAKKIVSRYSVGVDPQAEPSATIGMTFETWFQEQLAKAQQTLQQAKVVFQDLPQYIKQTSYLDSTAINATEPNVGGLIFDYGYAGHGPLDVGFSGFETVVDFVEIPNWLESAFKDSLGALGFGPLINVAPNSEFLLKTLLLLKDEKNNVLPKGDFVPELLFLIVRLLRTPSFKGFNTIFQQVPPIIKIMVNSFRIGPKGIIDFLDDSYKQAKWMVNYDFEIEGKGTLDLTKQELLDKKDSVKIGKIFAAIALQSAISYANAKRELLKTEKGKTIEQKLLDAKTKKEKKQARKKLHAAMPEYKEIRNTVASRIYGLIQRIRGYKQLREKLLNKIRPIVDPLLSELGLSMDMFVDSEQARKLEQEQLAQEYSEEVEYESLYEDEFFEPYVEGEF